MKPALGLGAYFRKALAAQLHGGKTLFLLTVAGVALGVAAVIGIQILNRNALAAFSGGVEAVSDRADLTVTSLTPELSEALYPRVLGTPGVAAAWPLLRLDVCLAEEPAVFLEVIGLDVFAPMGLAFGEAAAAAGENEAERGGAAALVAALSEPGWVALSPAFAAERGWQVGDTLAVTSGSRRVRLTVGALLDYQRAAPTASRKLAFMDIAQMQDLFGAAGRLDEIGVQLAAGVEPAAVSAALAARLGPEVQVQDAGGRRREAAGLLAAFRLNLTALSLISLVVGLFLIYSSVQAALVRRRAEFGLLRALGATAGQVLAIILAEAALLGALGTALGLPLGWWVARQGVATVSATLTNIYLLSEIERLTLPAALVWLAAAIGVGGALAGALLPALDMSRRHPRALLAPFTLHERTSRLAPRLALAALALAVLTLVWWFVAGRALRWSGFALGAALLVALPLSTPFFLRTLCARVPVARLGVAYSLRNLALRLGTSAFALAALAVAVSMLIAVTLLIGSFRRTLETWIGETVRADIYVAGASWTRAGGEAALDSALVEGLAGFPGVAAAERVVNVRARVYPSGRQVGLVGLMPDLEARGGVIPLYRGTPAGMLAGLAAGGVSLSEPLARKEGLGIGDSLALHTPAGVARLAVVAITFDYSSEAGRAMLHPATLARLYGPRAPSNLALYLAPGVEPEAVIDAIRAAYPGAPLALRSDRVLRAEILDIFDQTFAVTRLLQALALLIAVCGISLTLIILARERVAELALYRCLGAERRQLFGIFLGEGLSYGVLGSLLGLAGGVGLAAVLIFLINRAYFGWTIRAAWPGPEILRQLALILLAAIVASVYPALRASRTPATELSREI